MIAFHIYAGIVEASLKTRRTFSQAHAAPISLPWIHILLTLTDGVRHGYGIMREVEARTEGHVMLWPATLYGAIRRMQEEGLVTEVEPPRDAEDQRRKYYQLTSLGRRVLAGEVGRLEDVVSLARKRNILGAR